MSGVNCALLLFVVSNLLVTYVCGNITKKAALAAIDSYVNLGTVGTFSVGFTQTVTSFLLEEYMNKECYSLTIKVLNNMKVRSFVNPTIYLESGRTVSPPMLFINPIENDQNDAQFLKQTEIAKIAGEENKIKGFLCYNVNTSATTIEERKFCIGFKVKEKDNQFYVFNLDFKKDLRLRNELDYLLWISARQKGKSILARDKELKMLVSYQMTTGNDARIYVRVDDSSDIKTYQSALAKRELTLLGSVALGAVTGIAGTLAQAAYRYFKTVQATVLAIENLSKDPNPFVLYDPEWYAHEGINVETIIPSQVKQGQSMQVTLTSQTTFLETSVFVISFKVRSEDLERTKRLVLAIWWLPKMLGGRKKRYAVSMMDSINPKMSVMPLLEDYANAIKKYPTDDEKASSKLPITIDSKNYLNFGGQQNQAIYYISDGGSYYQGYVFWKLPLDCEKKMAAEGPVTATEITRNLKLLTAIGNGQKNMMVAKVFKSSQKAAKNDCFMPFPENYEYTKHKLPP